MTTTSSPLFYQLHMVSLVNILEICSSTEPARTVGPSSFEGPRPEPLRGLQGRAPARAQGAIASEGCRPEQGQKPKERGWSNGDKCEWNTVVYSSVLVWMKLRHSKSVRPIVYTAPAYTRKVRYVIYVGWVYTCGKQMVVYVLRVYTTLIVNSTAKQCVRTGQK